MNEDLERLLGLHKLYIIGELSDDDYRDYKYLIDLISSEIEECENHDCSVSYDLS